MTKTKKNRFPPSIAIPNNIIVNDGYNLSVTGFALYAILRLSSYLQKSNTIDFDYRTAMWRLGINDNRTLKQGINNLFDNNLVEGPLDSLTRKSNIAVRLTHVDVSRFFTLMPVVLLHEVSNIGVTGYRLMYYFGKDISPLSFDKDGVSNKYSFKSIDTISSSLRISVPSVIKYTKALEEAGLVSVIRDVAKNTGDYQENGKPMFSKSANKYYIVNGEIWSAKNSRVFELIGSR